MTLPVGWMCCETGDEGISVLIANKGKAQPGELWADSGCVRGVGGTKGHREFREYLKQFGLRPTGLKCNENFQFGDGNTETAKARWLYPTFLEGEYKGILDQCEVPADCPQLFSKSMLKSWDVDLRFGKQKIVINKFDIELPFSSRQLPIINIFDFTEKSLKKIWDTIPDHFKIQA